MLNQKEIKEKVGTSNLVISESNEKLLPIGRGIKHAGDVLSGMWLLPAAHWLFTEQPKVNSVKTALKTSNLRYFSGRSALGLFLLGAILKSTGGVMTDYIEDKILLENNHLVPERGGALHRFFNVSSESKVNTTIEPNETTMNDETIIAVQNSSPGSKM